jgi:DNA-binding transcriptional MocR family regulator
VIKLDEGSPDGSLFPPEPLARAFRTAALYAARRQQLGYRDPCGSDKLRASLATMLREERGLVVARKTSASRAAARWALRWPRACSPAPAPSPWPKR